MKLVVQDSGEGIPPEVLHRVTEPFFTTKPAGRGTGLGLAMVYGTVKAHGGSLDIQSEVGKGTRITLSFPAAGASTPQEASGPQVALPDHPLGILIVDDDEQLAGILRDMVTTLGHQGWTASSALEALRRLEGGLQVDLVILDHHMPGLSGAEALPRFFQVRPDLSVLLSTGFLDNDLKLLLAHFPAVRVLHKPYSLAELRRVLGSIPPLPG